MNTDILTAESGGWQGEVNLMADRQRQEVLPAEAHGGHHVVTVSDRQGLWANGKHLIGESQKRIWVTGGGVLSYYLIRWSTATGNSMGWGGQITSSLHCQIMEWQQSNILYMALAIISKILKN